MESSSGIRSSRRIGGRRENYWTAGLVGADEYEAMTTKLSDLKQCLARLELGSVFDAAVCAAQFGEDIIPFVEAGGLGKLYAGYAQVRKPRGGPLSLEVRQGLCAPAVDIYDAEWRSLTGRSSSFKHPLKEFSPEYVTEFNIESLYQQMATTAPCFVNLLCTIAPDQGVDDDDNDNPDLTIASAQHRRIATAMSILGNTRTRNFNALQGRVGYYLLACRVLKRVISMFNKLGLSPSYNGLLVAIRATAERAMENLTQASLNNSALQVSYDNCSF